METHANNPTHSFITLRATEEQKQQHQVNWILTPNRGNNPISNTKPSDPAQTRHIEALLTLGDYAYIPFEDLVPEQQEEVLLKESTIKQMKAQRLYSTVPASPLKKNQSNAHEAQTTPTAHCVDTAQENKGSCIKYAVYPSPLQSGKFRHFVNENEPVVVISPVRRSTRHLTMTPQKNHSENISTTPRLLNSLDELGSEVDYAWVPNQNIRGLPTLHGSKRHNSDKYKKEPISGDPFQ